RPPPLRRSAAVRFQALNMRCTPAEEAQPCFLDRETGKVLRLEMPAGEIVGYAVCSPWSDERGPFQAVGRGGNRPGKASASVPSDFGLARLSLPEGKVLERIPLDVTPISEPCWIPGPSPRILFPAGDGFIYWYDLPEPVSSPRPTHPQRVEWGI